MGKSLISWALVGVLTYAWYWAGYAWPYLQNTPSGNWEPVWLLYTVLVILIHRRSGTAAVGAQVLDTIIGRIKTIVGHFVGLLLAIIIGVTINTLVGGGGFVVNAYLQGVVLVLSCSILTSAMLGALDDATQ